MTKSKDSPPNRVELSEVQFLDKVSLYGRPGSLWNKSIFVGRRAALDWNGPEKVLVFDEVGKLVDCYPIHTVMRYKIEQ